MRASPGGFRGVILVSLGVLLLPAVPASPQDSSGSQAPDPAVQAEGRTPSGPSGDVLARQGLEIYARRDTPALELLSAAGDLFAAGQYPQAEKAYRQFIKRYPGDLHAIEAREMLAESLYRQAVGGLAAGEEPSQKTFAKAACAYKKARDKAPREDYLGESAALRLSEIAFNLKRYDEAEKGLAEMRRRYPMGILRGESRLLEAESDLAQLKSGAAVELLRDLLHDQPAYEMNSVADVAYGIGLFDIGKSSASLSYLDRKPTPLSLLYAGRALLDVDKPLLAVEKFRRVKEMKPDGPLAETADYLIAESFFKAKDYLAAIASFQQFLRDYPRSGMAAGADFKIGYSQYAREDYLQARGSFQSVLQTAPQGEFAEPALYMTGQSFLKENRYREAQFAFADVASGYSDGLAGVAQFKLAWCLYKQENWSAAESALTVFLSKYPEHPFAPVADLLLGNVLTREKRYAGAIRAYQRTINLLTSKSRGIELPGFAGSAEAGSPGPFAEVKEAALALIDRASLLLGDAASIVSSYQYLLNTAVPSLNRWRAATLLYTAEAYFLQGHFGKAQGLYQLALQSFPAAPEAAYAQDGEAWSLFKEGDYGAAQEAWAKLADFKNRPPSPAEKTVLADGKVPEEVFTDSEFEQACSYFNKKSYDRALAAFEAFEKAHPQSPLAAEAALDAGWSYYKLQYFGQAIQSWEGVQSAYPKTRAAYHAAWAAADTYFRAQKYDQAIAEYNRILTDYPDDARAQQARLKIAEADYNAKNEAKAVSEFQSLIEQAPDSAEAVQGLDFLAQLLERPESKAAALAALNSIADAVPGTRAAVEARFRIAESYYENNDYAQAAPLLEGVVSNLTAGDEMMDAEFALADCYYNLKNYKDAALAYARVTENYQGDKRYEGALFRLGTARFKTEKFAQAGDAFEELATKFPNSKFAPVALFNAGLAYRKSGRWEAAALALVTYIKKYPEQAKASNAEGELVSLYEENHQYAQAQDILLQGFKNDKMISDAQRAEAAYRLAQDYAASGNEEAAEAQYVALQNSPLKDNDYRLSALAKLADLYEKRQEYLKAASVYDDVAASSNKPEWVSAARARAASLREKNAESAPAASAAAQMSVAAPAPGAAAAASTGTASQTQTP